MVAPETSCLPCRIQRNRWAERLVAVVNNQVNKSARIAAATSRRNEGRDRYRGTQKKGQRPHSVLNAEDVAWAAESFDAFRAGLIELAKPEVAAWRRHELEQVKAATANQGQRAQRHIGDVIDRLVGGGRSTAKCLGDEHAFEAGARACVCGEVAAPDPADGHVRKRHGRRDGE